MAFTQAELYTHVANFLGEDSGLVAGSTHPAAVKIAALLEPAAAYVLALHPWNFASAVKRLQLDAEADPDVEDSDPIGWKYAFKKGAVLRSNWVSPTGRERDRLTRAGQWDDRGGRILANISPLYLDGVQAMFATEAKIGYWPAPVGVAISSVIGDWLQKPVTNSRGQQADMSERSADLVERAHTWDAQQAPPPSKREGRWNRSRRGSGFHTGEL